ncbi:hypothetical protein L0337_15250 [candidate division KSB1 bacterium]|nr:hypothetical protein [candidate division KSB1 bacterium]
MTSLHAQDRSAKFGRITVEHGLSSNLINSIAQDLQGFLWIGTDDGLNRYDGYQFKIYKYDPSCPGSISNNEVWCVYVDKSGALWAGTNGGGLCRYERATETFSCFQHLPRATPARFRAMRFLRFMKTAKTNCGWEPTSVA